MCTSPRNARKTRDFFGKRNTCGPGTRRSPQQNTFRYICVKFSFAFLLTLDLRLDSRLRKPRYSQHKTERNVIIVLKPSLFRRSCPITSHHVISGAISKLIKNDLTNQGYDHIRTKTTAERKILSRTSVIL